MNTILDRYIIRTVVAGTLVVLLILVGLGTFFDFLGEVDRIGTGEYGAMEAIQHVLSSMPLMAWEMFPIAALLGTLLALGGLAAHGELVAMRASGRSLVGIARAGVLGGALLAVLSVLLGDVIAPPAEQYAQAQRALAQHERLTIAGGQGVWARDGRQYVNVRQLSDGRRIDGIFIYEFGPDDRLERSVQAAAARYEAGEWLLESVEETHFTQAGTRVTRHAEWPWNTQLSPDLLSLFVVDPDSLDIAGLWHYIDYLERNGLDARRYQFAFWSKIVTPVSIMVMILLALPFVAGPQRSAGTGTRLLIGMLIGTGFFMVNQVLGFSGEVFELNPMFVAWLPTVVLAMAAGFALTRIR